MRIVNKLKSASLAMAIATAAMAPGTASAVTITTGLTTATTGTAQWGVNLGDSAGFTGGVSALGAFTHSYNFSLDDVAAASSTITSILLSGKDIDFSSINLDGNLYTGCNDGIFPCTATTDSWKIDALNLAAGSHTLTVNGNRLGATGSASYSGTLEVAAVPEPAAWGMMILGFGLVGAGMRSRKRQVVLA